MNINLRTIIPTEDNEITVEKINTNFRILAEQGVILDVGAIGEKGEKGDDGKGAKGDRGGLTFLYDDTYANFLAFISAVNLYLLSEYEDDLGIKKGDVIITIRGNQSLLTTVSSSNPVEPVEDTALSKPPYYDINFKALIQNALTNVGTQSFIRADGDGVSARDLVVYDRLKAGSRDLSSFRFWLTNIDATSPDTSSTLINNIKLIAEGNDALLSIMPNTNNGVSHIRLVNKASDSLDNTNDTFISTMPTPQSILTKIELGKGDIVTQGLNTAFSISGQSLDSTGNVLTKHNLWLGIDSLEKAVNTGIFSTVDGLSYINSNSLNLDVYSVGVGKDKNNNYYGLFAEYKTSGGSTTSVSKNGLTFNATDIDAKLTIDNIETKFNIKSLTSNDGGYDILTENGIVVSDKSIKIKSINNSTSNIESGIYSLASSLSGSGYECALKIFQPRLGVNGSSIHKKVSFEVNDKTTQYGDSSIYPEIWTNAEIVFRSSLRGESKSFSEYESNNFYIGLKNRSEPYIRTSDTTETLVSKSIIVKTGDSNVFGNVGKDTGNLTVKSGNLTDSTITTTNISQIVTTYASNKLGKSGSLILSSGSLRDFSNMVIGGTVSLSSSTMRINTIGESGSIKLESGGVTSYNNISDTTSPDSSYYTLTQKSGDINISSGESDYVGSVNVNTGWLHISRCYSQVPTTPTIGIGFNEYSSQTNGLNLVLNGYKHENTAVPTLGINSGYLANRLDTSTIDGAYDTYDGNQLPARFASPLQFAQLNLHEYSRDVKNMGLLRISSGLDSYTYNNSTTMTGHYLYENTLEAILGKNGVLYSGQTNMIDTTYHNKLSSQSLSLFSTNTMLQQSFSDIIIHAGANFGHTSYNPSDYTAEESTNKTFSSTSVGQRLDTSYAGRSIYLFNNFANKGEYVPYTNLITSAQDTKITTKKLTLKVTENNTYTLGESLINLYLNTIFEVNGNNYQLIVVDSVLKLAQIL